MVGMMHLSKDFMNIFLGLNELTIDCVDEIDSKFSNNKNEIVVCDDFDVIEIDLI